MMPDVFRLFEDDASGTEVCDIDTPGLEDPTPESDPVACERNEAKPDVEAVEFMMPDVSRPFEEDEAKETKICDIETAALGDSTAELDPTAKLDPTAELDPGACESNEVKLDVAAVESFLPDVSTPVDEEAKAADF